MKPNHLEKAKAITESGLLKLSGNRMLIELLSEEEQKTKSGIITSAGSIKPKNSEFSARAAVVLAVGPGYTAEDTGEQVDMPFKAGDYILVNYLSVKTFSDFFGMADYKPDTVGIITDDLVQGYISDIDQFCSVLKS